MTDDPSFEILNPTAGTPILLLGDHASNRVPADVNGGSLGLPEKDMNRHIAFDIGVRGVIEHLSELLDAEAIMSTFSRLVIDPNRGEDDPTLVMKLYDGSIITGNKAADEAEKERRLQRFHRPYHGAITGRLDQLISNGRYPCLVSVHSFTPQLKNRPLRPWHLGVLWDQDDRLVRPFMRYFQNDDDIVVGDNEPYSGALKGDTMYRHGTCRDIPHILIEIRHDLINTPEGQKTWAERIAPAILVATRSVTEN